MKKHIVTTIATASVAAVSLSATVSADEVVKPAETTVVDEKVEKAEVVITEADVKASEEAVANSQAAVDAQKEIITKAETVKSTADVAMTAAQNEVASAEELAKEATPEKIEETKAEITKTETAIPEADEAITVAESEVTKATTTLDNQDRVVEATRTDLNAKTEVVNEAQADVANAQAVLDGTNQASVVAEAESAKTNLDTTKADLANAEAELAKAKEVDVNREAAIAEWTAKTDESKAELGAKETALTNAGVKTDETKGVAANAEAKLADAENALNAINTIKMTPEYIAAFNDYMNHYFEKGTEAKKILNGLAKEHQALNKFKANPEDDKIVINANNMTDEQLTELSQLAADLMTQIRTQFGKKEAVVTPSAVQFAKEVSKGYVADNWSWNDALTKGHDEDAVLAVAKKLGLENRQMYENMNTYSKPHAVMTMSKAKEYIYEAIKSFMFNGWEYLHAQALLGVFYKNPVLVGVSLSSRTDSFGVHFLMVDDTHIIDPSKFDKTVIPNPYNSEAIREAYSVAKVAYDEAKAEAQKANADKAEAQKAYDEAKAIFDTANEKLAELKAQGELTPAAQVKRDEAKADVDAATVRHDKAQEALANLSADVKTKQAALAKAKEVLAEKEADKAKVVNQLTIEVAKQAELAKVLDGKKEALVEAKANKAALEDKLAGQKTRLEKLTNIPKMLEEAKANLLKAKDQLTKATDALEMEVNKLKKLEAKHADLTAQHAKVLDAYQKALEAERQMKLGREKAEIIKSGEIPAPVFNEKGDVIAYVAEQTTSAKVTSINANQTSPQSTMAKVGSRVEKNSLPKTNDGGNLFGLVGLLLSGVALSGLKRKYK